MAEIVAEKAICDGCGVDVREGSAFCYNCGETISGADVPEPDSVSPRPVPANGDLRESALREPNVISKGGASVGETIEVPDPDAKPLAKAGPAAAIKRRRTRAYNRKPTEVVWAEREGSPKSYIIVSFVLFVLAGILTILALYVK